jgi:hypothetical protein
MKTRPVGDPPPVEFFLACSAHESFQRCSLHREATVCLTRSSITVRRGFCPALEKERVRSDAMTKETRILLLCVAAVLSLGCYRYVPLELETAPVGTRVRAVLTTEGRIGVRMRAGLIVESLNATLLQKGADTLLFAVRWLGPWSDFGSRITVERRVEVPREDIMRIDRRELDKAKTYSLIGGIVAAGAVGTYLLFREKEPGGGPLVPPKEPFESVTGVLVRLPLLPLLRLPR